MHMIRKKELIVTLLFLFLYCAFVVSPLTYNHPVKGIDEQVVAHKKSAYPGLNLNIFFLELICQGLDNDGDIDDNASTVRILVKRPRAVLRKDVNVKVAFSESLALHGSGSPLLSYSSSQLIIAGDEQIPPGDISPLYSGHSPPPA